MSLYFSSGLLLSANFFGFQLRILVYRTVQEVIPYMPCSIYLTKVPFFAEMQSTEVSTII